jgi:hypothetical protein
MLARIDEMSEEEIDAALDTVESEAESGTETPLPRSAE